MKPLIFSSILLLIGFVSGAAVQYYIDHFTILNLGNPILVFQDGEPIHMEFNDTLDLKPGSSIEIIGGL